MGNGRGVWVMVQVYGSPYGWVYGSLYECMGHHGMGVSSNNNNIINTLTSEDAVIDHALIFHLWQTLH